MMGTGFPATAEHSSASSEGTKYYCGAPNGAEREVWLEDSEGLGEINAAETAGH
jgi:hypothetical protein